MVKLPLLTFTQYSFKDFVYEVCNSSVDSTGHVGEFNPNHSS